MPALLPLLVFWIRSLTLTWESCLCSWKTTEVAWFVTFTLYGLTEASLLQYTQTHTRAHINTQLFCFARATGGRVLWKGGCGADRCDSCLMSLKRALFIFKSFNKKTPH